MHRFSPCGLIALLSVLASPALAVEWQQFELVPPSGIKAIEASDGQIFVKDLTDVWSRAHMKDGKLTLSPSPQPPENLSPDPDKLPDTDVALGQKNIVRAWFAQPTRRYDHGVLGDDIEAGSLKVTAKNGETYEIVLPENAVFEDRIPRLVDLNQDGTDEIIVVKSYVNRGAAVALVGALNTNYEIVAESPAIGLSHRWLNPIGAADFDGDGTVEIAVVITPHIGGTLQLYEWQGDRLVKDHSAFGFSNHAMGSRELGLSATVDLNRDGVKDIIVPDAGRRALKGVSFANGRATVLHHFEISGTLSSGLHAVDLDRDGIVEILYATDNEAIIVLKRSP